MKTFKPDFCKIQTIMFLFFVLISVATSYSQNIATSNLTWQASEATDLQTQKVMTYEATFKTNGTQVVEWIQKDGERTSTYTVTGTEGTWPDISATGMFTYLLTRNGKASRMAFERSEGGLFVTLDFTQPGGPAIKQRFRIQSVQAK